MKKKEEKKKVGMKTKRKDKEEREEESDQIKEEGRAEFGREIRSREMKWMGEETDRHTGEERREWIVKYSNFHISKQKNPTLQR